MSESNISVEAFIKAGGVACALLPDHSYTLGPGDTLTFEGGLAALQLLVNELPLSIDLNCSSEGVICIARNYYAMKESENLVEYWRSSYKDLFDRQSKLQTNYDKALTALSAAEARAEKLAEELEAAEAKIAAMSSHVRDLHVAYTVSNIQATYAIDDSYITQDLAKQLAAYIIKEKLATISTTDSFIPYSKMHIMELKVVLPE